MAKGQISPEGRTSEFSFNNDPFVIRKDDKGNSEPASKMLKREYLVLHFTVIYCYSGNICIKSKLIYGNHHTDTLQQRVRRTKQTSEAGRDKI